MSEDTKKPPEKKNYERPKIVSEPWLVNGAGVTCNGTTLNQRKDSVGSPNFCRANRLLS